VARLAPARWPVEVRQETMPGDQSLRRHVEISIALRSGSRVVARAVASANRKVASAGVVTRVVKLCRRAVEEVAVAVAAASVTASGSAVRYRFAQLTS
jgi:hypothetical protein